MEDELVSSEMVNAMEVRRYKSGRITIGGIDIQTLRPSERFRWARSLGLMPGPKAKGRPIIVTDRNEKDRLAAMTPSERLRTARREQGKNPA